MFVSLCGDTLFRDNKKKVIIIINNWMEMQQLKQCLNDKTITARLGKFVLEPSVETSKMRQLTV